MLFDWSKEVKKYLLYYSLDTDNTSFALSPYFIDGKAEFRLEYQRQDKAKFFTCLLLSKLKLELELEIAQKIKEKNKMYGLKRLYRIDFLISEEHPIKFLGISFNDDDVILKKKLGVSLKDLYTIYSNRKHSFGSKKINSNKLKSIALNSQSPIRKNGFINYKEILEIVDSDGGKTELKFSKNIKVGHKSI